jgi:iron complex transport system substrate-binding protein
LQTLLTPPRFPRLTGPLARTVALAATVLVTASACGSTAPEPAADTTDASTGTTAVAGGAADPSAAETGDAAAGFPVEIDSTSGVVTIESRPEAIVSMSPTATEMLFAVGAGDQVTAVDSFSNYPREAPVTDLSAFEPNLEAIAAQEPDLVVMGYPNPEIEDGLAGLGIPVLILPAAVTLDDTYDQIAQLGLATGQIDQAATVNADIRAEIDEIMAERPAAGGEPVRVYHELDETFFSASSGSFIGQLYEMLGFENIADAADPDGSIQYPQLQPEQILEADPSLIVITDAYGYGPTEIAGRPGWEALSAVADGNIVQLDDDVASRWGPRVVELLRQIATAVPAPASS